MTASPVQRANERPSVRFPGARASASTAKNTSADGSIMLERLVVPSPGQLLQGDIHVLEPLARSDEQIFITSARNSIMCSKANSN